MIGGRLFNSATLYVIVIGLILTAGFGVLIGSEALPPGLIVVVMVMFLLVVTAIARPYQESRVILLAYLLFLLAFYPTARIEIGNMPLYFVDILTGLLLLPIILRNEVFSARSMYARRLYMFVTLLWLPSTIFSFLHEVLLTSIWLETTYMLTRVLLSLSIFFLIPVIVQNERELRLLLMTIASGAAATATLAVINAALPVDHPVLEFINSLTPSDLQLFQRRYLEGSGVVRARALIGGPNHLGSLLILSWSIIYAMFNSGHFRRTLLGPILFIVFLGIIVTYTRSVYLGFALIITWFLLKSARNRGRIILNIIIALLLGLVVVSSTNLFNFDFIIGRFMSISEQGTADDGNAARVDAYTQVPGYLVNNPQWLFVGRGFATYDLALRGLLERDVVRADFVSTETHSTIVATFYQRGLLSTVIFIAVWLSAYYLMNRYIRPDNPYRWLAIGVQSALIGMIPGWLFDHFYVNTIHMQTFMYLIFGLAAVTAYLSEVEQQPD
jgi:hypothetical protein